MTYHVRLSSPTRFPAIPAPSRTRKLWSYVEAVPYQLQTWWRNAKRRWRWRRYVLVECQACGLDQLAYRVEPVIMRDGTVERQCLTCRKSNAIWRIVFHTQREQ